MLTVYVAGLIYFDGCNQPVRHMYAPDGTTGKPVHHASLWVAADLLEESATQWWAGFRHSHTIAGTPVVEFRMPNPAQIRFPDDGTPGGTCDDLENKLAKLKKKKDDGTEEPYEIDPSNAEIIAEVTINRGNITPRRFKQMTLVEWTIPSPSTLQIITWLKSDSADSRTITLKPSAAGVEAEVVFANTHDLSLDNKDLSADGHDLALFKKLNLALGGATLVSKKAPGSVGGPSTEPAIFEALRKMQYSGGDPPNCCHL
ncbi:MAG TPA: hypothetical protein VM733_08430 [Thermoanaerobaculia bacterium]|nr:hypothetical protein [Thermoanaerobaculia bacterium]